MGRDAVPDPVFAEATYRIGRTTDFKRTRFLEIFTFESDLTTCYPVDRARRKHGRAVDKRCDALCGGANVVECWGI